MRIFSKLYLKVMGYARHRHAPLLLFCVGFAESSFFLVPPDVMLIPMSLAQPKRAWRLATLTTISSVLGGCFGYFLGYFFFQLIMPWIHHFGYDATYLKAVEWFKLYGFWAVIVAGFSPIPYKIFTISAGALHMDFWPFVLASLVGRGLRFFLVAGLMRYKGVQIEEKILKYIDYLGWLMIGAVLVFLWIYYATDLFV